MNSLHSGRELDGHVGAHAIAWESGSIKQHFAVNNQITALQWIENSGTSCLLGNEATPMN
jgi:hypothetical protein